MFNVFLKKYVLFWHQNLLPVPEIEPDFMVVHPIAK